jgi:multiple sugar transport system permease protein
MSMRWENIMAAAVVVTPPVILLYMLLQRYVVSGLTGGAVRG